VYSSLFKRSVASICGPELYKTILALLAARNIVAHGRPLSVTYTKRGEPDLSFETSALNQILTSALAAGVATRVEAFHKEGWFVLLDNFSVLNHFYTAAITFKERLISNTNLGVKLTPSECEPLPTIEQGIIEESAEVVIANQQ